MVPGGETWNVESIDADGVYFNGVGPATQLECVHIHEQRRASRRTGLQRFKHPDHAGWHDLYSEPGPAAVLSCRHVLDRIQANMDFATQGEWGWTDRTVQSNSPAQWQNPGGGFGLCPYMDE